MRGDDMPMKVIGEFIRKHLLKIILGLLALVWLLIIRSIFKLFKRQRPTQASIFLYAKIKQQFTKYKGKFILHNRSFVREISLQKKPAIYFSMYGETYECDHPVHNSRTLFKMEDKEFNNDIMQNRNLLNGLKQIHG